MNSSSWGRAVCSETVSSTYKTEPVGGAAPLQAVPLIILVGGGALAERVCAELTLTTGCAVHVLWPLEAERRAAFALKDVVVFMLPPNTDESLLVAGVREASSILVLAKDDGLNLAIALRARMLNPKIRIVLRQLNVTLGRKIAQNLADCAVVSPSSHSAATYAGAALDRACFFALRFPSIGGSLVGFVRATAAERRFSGLTVAECEQHSRSRVLALNGRTELTGGDRIQPDDVVVTFGPIRDREPSGRSRTAEAGKPPASVDEERPRRFTLNDIDLLSAFWRLNPIVRTYLFATVTFLGFAFSFFHFVLHKTWTASAFSVVATLTAVGFGESSVTRRGVAVTAGAIVAMLGGIVLTSLFIGYISSALTRAEWIAMQGLRRIHARGHVIVCGGGSIGSTVIDLLTSLGKHVVVVEPQPGTSLVRRARDPDVDLLTGDATSDDALDLCDIPNASAVLALTNSDSSNLEIALSARARSPDVPLVVRMESDTFARATAALFGISTFSPAALVAPEFAALSHSPGMRGRVTYSGEQFTVGQRVEPEGPPRQADGRCRPLCVWRGQHLLLIRDMLEVKPRDLLLFVVAQQSLHTAHTDPSEVAPAPAATFGMPPSPSHLTAEPKELQDADPATPGAPLQT
jgi:voltage-gated potassium channel Kch